MTTVTLEEAQARLPELIENLPTGEELVITQDQRPIARLRAEKGEKRIRRKAGNCKGMLTIVADDDEYLKREQKGEQKGTLYFSFVRS